MFDLEGLGTLKSPGPRDCAERAATPRELTHLDIKKLGRFPRVMGTSRRLGGAAAGRNSKSGPGCGFLRHAVPDHTRLGYVEIYPDKAARRKPRRRSGPWANDPLPVLDGPVRVCVAWPVGHTLRGPLSVARQR